MKYKIIKYEKNAEIIVNDEKMTLMEHLKKERSKKKITKKEISLLIKGNEYWYSQLERDGKKGDDNRRKYIEENELINIISVVIFDSKTKDDLLRYQLQSMGYIQELHLMPIDAPYRYPSQHKSAPRTNEQQVELISELLNSINQSINEFAVNLDNYARNTLIAQLKNFDRTLKRNPDFALEVAGLEFEPIFDKSSNILSYNFLNKLQSALDSKELNEEFTSAEELRELITQYYDEYKKEMNKYWKRYDIKF